ncbi:hypothetical protein CPB86DRAFT_296765 [Serendipita vermifera]|nr:hypothetical protein CPB86DRAFT_296765 [Serendipita vermifera]
MGFQATISASSSYACSLLLLHPSIHQSISSLVGTHTQKGKLNLFPPLLTRSSTFVDIDVICQSNHLSFNARSSTSIFNLADPIDHTARTQPPLLQGQAQPLLDPIIFFCSRTETPGLTELPLYLFFCPLHTFAQPSSLLRIYRHNLPTPPSCCSILILYQAHFANKSIRPLLDRRVFFFPLCPSPVAPLHPSIDRSESTNALLGTILCFIPENTPNEARLDASAYTLGYLFCDRARRLVQDASRELGSCLLHIPHLYTPLSRLWPRSMKSGLGGLTTAFASQVEKTHPNGRK